ncbi:MAG TPA: hypothetical protein VD995_32320 [Azospirillum sp.]|nr:hypothetical protein [Azospirillum sp.]
MADAQIGRPDYPIRPTGVVERTGSATDRQQRRQQQHREPERRDQEPPNPKRRRIYDMLFEEIDQIDALDERQRTRIKDNIRSHLTGAPRHDAPHGRRPYATGYAQPPPAQPEPPPPAEPIVATPDAVEPIDPDHLVEVAAPVHPHLPPEEAQENARLARQLRECLALHTERARKVAVYLQLLLRLDQSLRPHLVVDI